MRVLLFGANGQVGSACLPRFITQGWDVIPRVRADVDFTQPDAVYAAVIEYAPNIVVNACAYTAVDKAETDQETALLVNASSVAAMGKACAALNIPTVHISTDYVFSGTATTPYTEADAVAPTGVYGATKLQGEQQLAAANPQHITLRTSWVFGEQGNNFVKTMLRLAQTRSELGVVADQRGCPTYAGDIADVIVALLQHYQQNANLPWGIYHCSNAGECSWYDFANQIFTTAVSNNLLTSAPKVNAITTADYPTPAQRPAYSVLNTQKLQQLLVRPMPQWMGGLCQVIESLKDQTGETP